MKVQLVRFVYAIAFILVAVYATATLTGPKGIAALLKTKREIRDLEQSVTSLQTDIERRQQRIQRLTVDQDEQERVIKDRYKYVGPDDLKVYMLPEGGKK